MRAYSVMFVKWMVDRIGQLPSVGGGGMEFPQCISRVAGSSCCHRDKYERAMEAAHGVNWKQSHTHTFLSHYKPESKCRSLRAQMHRVARDLAGAFREYVLAYGDGDAGDGCSVLQGPSKARKLITSKNKCWWWNEMMNKSKSLQQQGKRSNTTRRMERLKMAWYVDDCARIIGDCTQVAATLDCGQMGQNELLAICASDPSTDETRWAIPQVKIR